MSGWLPEGVAAWGALGLVGLSALTSMLTAAVGIGGGVTLLAAMALVVPVHALIPVHGVVQLGSNLGRAVVLSRSAMLRMLVPFTLGALAGVALGALLVTELPEAALLFAIGAFVLFTTWVRLPPLGRGERGVLAAGGAGATLLTMFVGATGPFVLALLRQAGLPHRALVATTAAAMTVQHGLKVAAFSAIGFAFADWAALMAAMIVAGFAGTLVGARALDWLPEERLKRALKLVLTLVGAQLVVRAALQLA